MRDNKIFKWILVLFLCLSSVHAFANDLTFDELVELSQEKEVGIYLKNKLDATLNTPIVVNNTVPIPKQNNDPIIGNFIRVATWNIARGKNIETIKLIYENPEELYSKIKCKKHKKLVKKQAEILRNIDILMLNEVDIGMPRTGYKNIAEELARVLKFNYAYGVEFVEVDPTHLGLEDYEWSEENILFPDKDYVIDKSKYKGLHGNAILSRYPLKNVRIIRLPDYYGWFAKEKDKVAGIEVVRRKAADFIFDEDVFREIRRGSRMALLADVEVPGLEVPLTVISLHLENRTIPRNRYKQIQELLDKIKHIDNPVVLAGDFNTTTTDGSPTTIKREIGKKLTDVNFLGRQVINVVIPYSLVVNVATGTTNLLRKHCNPTIRNIPIIAPNPERKFFNTLKKFKFADNGRFDFKGDRYKALNNKGGMLSASNERRLKAFTPTFVFNRGWYFGKFKLDWIFVKPDKTRFQPFYGRTLFELNYALDPALSDHVPVTVDLPLNAPSKKEVKARLRLFQ